MTLPKNEESLNSLLESACAHARVGKHKAADLAFEIALDIAWVIGMTYRTKYARMILDRCRSTITKATP